MLSVIIITKNESQHIARCLESVRFANEIIVLDSGSTDNTVELCKAYTDKVFVTDWPGFGIQKQRALDKASGDWVLSIDADEQVSAELRVEIEKAIQNNQVDGFEIPRLSSYCGRNMKHGGWWPDYVLRLFKRKLGNFSPELVHERIYVTGKIAKLTQPLLHESFVDASEVLDKINAYSSLGAQRMYQLGKRTCLTEVIFKGLWTFIRTYFIKMAFLDGGHGLRLAISNAEGAYYRYTKLLDLQEKHTKQVALISVIVSTYNRPDALEACLQSLLQQTDQHFEIVIADDGSTLKTHELIDKYKAQSSVPIVHVYQPDDGFQLSMIRNKAAAQTKGNYFIFMDGDCLVLPNFVAKHRELATLNYFVAGNRVLLNQALTKEVLLTQLPLYLKPLSFFIKLRLANKINRVIPLFTLPLDSLRYLQTRNWRKAVGCNTAMWKTDFLAVNGYDENFVGWGHEDSDLVIRLMHKGIYRKEGRFAVPVLHLWHQQNDRSEQQENYQRLMERLAKKDFIQAEKGVSQYLG